MLCSTNVINPKFQNITAAAPFMLQNTLDMQQFQHFQEAPALSSLFPCMVEERPRFLNAQPHIQGGSKCCSSSWSSHWPCWRNLEATTPCYLQSISWPGNLSPYPTGHPVCELCVQVTKRQPDEVTQFPSHQKACRKSGRERVTATFHNLWHHWAHRKQSGAA